eukprot:g13026.t1
MEVREITLDAATAGDGSYDHDLEKAEWRAGLRDCPAITFGGGNPARFAYNLLRMKQEWPDVWDELHSLIEAGQLLVFAYSAGAFVAGKSGDHWLADPDDETYFDEDGISRAEARRNLKQGTLDLLGNMQVKPHFAQCDRLSLRDKVVRMWEYVNTEAPAAQVILLGDSEIMTNHGERDYMDFIVVRGNLLYMLQGGPNDLREFPNGYNRDRSSAPRKASLVQPIPVLREPLFEEGRCFAFSFLATR